LLLLPFLGRSQERCIVKGTVRSADSLLALPNVHIISKQARRGTISDNDGKFAISCFTDDSLWFSSLGFRHRILHLDQDLPKEDNEMLVLLVKDTVKMEEVVIHSFYDWPTFKYLFVNMTTIKPVELERINEELENSILYLKPVPLTIKGPVQALYDYFNEMARLQRRLERNRYNYNQQLIKEGREKDTIPLKPEHYFLRQ